MTLFNLFIAFVRVGVFGYGGGPSLIPLVQVEVVEKYQWMTVEEFADVFAMGNALPGPIATKMAAYVGYKIAGVSGALSAIVGLVAPTALAMVLLANLFLKYKDAPQLNGMLKAVRPVIVILLVQVVYQVSKKAFPNSTTIIIAGLTALAIFNFNIHPAVIIVLAMAYGFFFF